MVTFAPIGNGSGIPPYSDGGIHQKPETNDWIHVLKDGPQHVDIKEIEEKFWEYLKNNKEFQELSERCKTGTLGISIMLDKKVAELKEQFIAENPQYAEAEKNTNKGFNPFGFGAISQGGLLHVLS